MTQTVDSSERARQATQFRDAMVDELRTDGMITTTSVEEAFLTVPRHEFVPDETSLEVAYRAYDAVVTKRDRCGVSVSSVSAPFIQAQMLEQAQLRPGMRVLEIGSGGYNAALLAEVVGPDGYVVTIDIDPEVTDQASTLLDAAGYGSRVRVLCADAEHGVAGEEPFDRIIVTVGAWDIPPAWLDQLTCDGIIVLPLRMNGITRSIGFHRDGDHLVGGKAEVCGFVAMQGAGSHTVQQIVIHDAEGGSVTLEFDAGVPAEPGLLRDALNSERVEVWSGITIEHKVSFADLHLWFATHLSGFCQFITDKSTKLSSQRAKTWFPYGVASGDSFAYLAVRPAQDGAGVEFGAHAYGGHGEATATALVEQIQAWHHHARNRPAPTFGYWPTGSNHRPIPTGAVIVAKTNGLAAVSWPDAD